LTGVIVSKFSLKLLNDGSEGKQIALHAETGDDASSNATDDRIVTEFFTSMRIANVNLNEFDSTAG
jgi:hypothetical protein